MFKTLQSAPESESASDSLHDAVSPYSAPSYRITITVVEGKGIIGDRDAFCKLCVNSPNCQIQKTKSRKTATPQWNQEFIFEPLFRNAPMIITLWNNNLLSKSELLGCVRLIPMRIIRDEVLYDDWFELEPLNTPRYRNTPIIKGGKIRLQIKWERLIQKIETAHYGFDEPIEHTRLIRDTSGKGIHLRFKNLDTSDIESAEGVNRRSRSAYFSGFNYLESSYNPTRNLTEFTISFWFKSPAIEKDFSMLSTITSNKTLILQEYNNNNIHQLSTESAASHLEKLYTSNEPSSPVITLTTQPITSNTNYLASPRGGNPNNTNNMFSLSVGGMNDEKRIRRLSLNSLAALNSSFSLKRGSNSKQAKKDLTDESIISKSGFIIGTKKVEFYDCRGQSLVTEFKLKQKTTPNMTPSLVPELQTPTHSTADPRVDYELIFSDILSLISDSEECYLTKDATRSSLSLRVYDEPEETSESFPREELFDKDSWNHVVYVYSGDRLREYINNILMEDQKCDFRILGCGLNRLCVGASNDEYCFEGFKGFLDEISIHNYAMNKSEVSKLYKFKEAQ